jgi:hypothetical protein
MWPSNTAELREMADSVERVVAVVTAYVDLNYEERRLAKAFSIKQIVCLMNKPCGKMVWRIWGYYCARCNCHAQDHPPPKKADLRVIKNVRRGC